MTTRILITGASGLLGQALLRQLRTQNDLQLLATSRRCHHGQASHQLRWRPLDVSDRRAVMRCVAQFRPHAIVHLAALLNPPAGLSEAELEHHEVGGTRNVLDAAAHFACSHIVISSSGAAYGYYADNPAWLDEDAPLRGHPAFAYARHKAAIEALLADYRQQHPALKQLVLRIGTVLGPHTNNLISDLFNKPCVLGIRGSQSPFVFIWEDDVAAIIAHGLAEQRSGCFNVAGDGALSLREIAACLHKPYLALPAGLLGSALAVLHRLGLSQYQRSQIDFLRYRPVLCNRRLKEVFGYTPRYNSAQALAAFIAAQSTRLGGTA